MKSYYILLAVVLALAGSTTSAMATEAKRSVENSAGGRMMRAQTTDEERVSLRNLFMSTEPRIKRVNEKNDKDMTDAARQYAKKGKPDEFVRQKFGLPTKSRYQNAIDDTYVLKAQRNFKYYEIYLKDKVKHYAYNSVIKGESTSKFWKSDNIRKDSPEYEKYAGYLQMYDNAAIDYVKRHKKLPSKMRFGGSDAEKMAKVDIWVAQDRPQWYVEKLLTHKVAKGANEYYLVEFWKKTEKKLKDQNRKEAEGL